jgi:hypothetical protein
MSSSLWRVALLTVTPPIWIGSSIANGTMFPVRPTLTAIRSSFVTAVVGANLKAIAQRGSRPTTPSASATSYSSIFTTTPSISKSSSSRRSSHRRHAPSTDPISSCDSTSLLTLKPCPRSHSSDCEWRSCASSREAPMP